MNKITIAKSLIGLAATGATIAGAVFVAFPSQKIAEVDIEQ